MPAWRIILGEVREQLRLLPAQRYHTVCTSPPYWGLRTYQTDGVDWPAVRYTPMTGCQEIDLPAWHGELGSEPTIELFIGHLLLVFDEVWRVLRDDGTFWLNIGDTAITGAGKVSQAPRGGFDPDQRSRHFGKNDRRGNPATLGITTPNRLPGTGLREKNKAGIPWRLAFALQARGWYLRSDIIWHKPNVMPSSTKDKPSTAHEFVFLLTKGPQYFYDAVATMEDVSGNAHSRGHGVNPKAASVPKQKPSGPKANGAYAASMSGLVEKRLKRDVWTISTHSFRGAHFATFPPRLVEPCLQAGTSAAGCCSICGTPYVRIVEKERVPTRPGTKSKLAGVNSRMYQRRDPQRDEPYKEDRLESDRGTQAFNDHRPDKKAIVNRVHHPEVVGNRDPERHVTRLKTLGFKRGCECSFPKAAEPCRVLDPFGGAGTTVLQALRMGLECDAVEINREYAAIAVRRVTKDIEDRR